MGKGNRAAFRAGEIGGGTQRQIIKNTAGKWILELDEKELRCLLSDISNEDQCRECPYKPSHVTLKCRLIKPDDRPCNYIAWQIGEALDADN